MDSKIQRVIAIYPFTNTEKSWYKNKGNGDFSKHCSNPYFFGKID